MTTRSWQRKFGEMSVWRLLALCFKLYSDFFFSLLFLSLCLALVDWVIDQFWAIGMIHFADNAARETAVKILFYQDAGLFAWLTFASYHVIVVKTTLRWSLGRRFRLWLGITDAGPTFHWTAGTFLLTPIVEVAALVPAGIGLGVRQSHSDAVWQAMGSGLILMGFIAALILFIRLTPITAVACREKKYFITALARSLQITSGYLWHGIALIGLAVVPILAMDYFIGSSDLIESLAGPIVNKAMGYILHRIFSPLLPIACAVFYLEIIGRRALAREARMENMIV